MNTRMNLSWIFLKSEVWILSIISERKLFHRYDICKRSIYVRVPIPVCALCEHQTGQGSLRLPKSNINHDCVMRSLPSPLSNTFDTSRKRFHRDRSSSCHWPKSLVNVTNLYNLPPKITLINKIIFLRKKFVHCVRDFNIDININIKLIVELTKWKFRSKVNFHGNGNVARVFIPTFQHGGRVFTLSPDAWFLIHSSISRDSSSNFAREAKQFS